MTLLVLVRMWYAFFTIGAGLWCLIVALSYLPGDDDFLFSRGRLQ